MLVGGAECCGPDSTCQLQNDHVFDMLTAIQSDLRKINTKLEGMEEINTKLENIEEKNAKIEEAIKAIQTELKQNTEEGRERGLIVKGIHALVEVIRNL